MLENYQIIKIYQNTPSETYIYIAKNAVRYTIEKCVIPLLPCSFIFEFAWRYLM